MTSASVTRRPGTVEDTNTGHSCTSGRLLEVRLVGDFPRTTTTGHPVLPGQPAPDVTVRAMDLTVDAESGVVCLLGVRTGVVEPRTGATLLPVP